MSSEKLNAAIAALERCLDSLKAESTGTRFAPLRVTHRLGS
jgi:hypothetical protein